MPANPISIRTSVFTRLAITAAAVALAACGSDKSATEPGGNTGGGTPTIIYNLIVDTTLKDSVKATVATQVPVRVQLTKAGVAVPNGTVHWKATLGSGKVSADSNVTDANGVATILWTLGDTAGFNTIAISSFDASVSYHAVGTAGAPSDLIRVSPDSMALVAGASVPLFVRSTDHLGNGTGGVTVNWSTSAGAISLQTTPAGDNGGASTVFTSPTIPGTYTVTAAVPGHASVTFKIVAL